jgi:hypothetical protein
MQITKRPAENFDTEFVRHVHHLAYRDVVIRQYGAWDEKVQDEFFAKRVRENCHSHSDGMEKRLTPRIQ